MEENIFLQKRLCQSIDLEIDRLKVPKKFADPAKPTNPPIQPEWKEPILIEHYNQGVEIFFIAVFSFLGWLFLSSLCLVLVYGVTSMLHLNGQEILATFLVIIWLMWYKKS